MSTKPGNIALLCTSLSLLPLTNASAQQCNIHFNYGVVIDPSHVRILDQDKTIVQINQANQLFVQGRETELTTTQKALVTNYVSGIRQQVPEIVSLAIEGVDLGLKAVNKVIAGVTGENSAAHQKLQKKFDELQWRLRKRFNQSDQNYYIAPQDFNDFDQIFAGQFEKEIEAIVTESIGTILMAVGEAISNREDDGSESRVSTFDQRIETMGDELELEMSSKVNALEAKAAMFCEKLKKLDEIEQQLSKQIPSLKSFDLITSN